VYRYCIEAGLNGGYGLTLLPSDPLPLTEDSPLRDPDPFRDDHDNIRMEQALRGATFDGSITILRLGMVYGNPSRSRSTRQQSRIHSPWRAPASSTTGGYETPST